MCLFFFFSFSFFILYFFFFFFFGKFLMNDHIIHIQKRHAKRTNIATDDVMLLARRNEGLEEILKDYLTKIKPTPPAATTTSGGKKIKSKGGKEKKGGR